MQPAQNGTNTQTQEVEVAQNDQDFELLKVQQEQWITFCALGGLMTFESDSEDKPQQIEQMTISEFSRLTTIPRRTLYNWKESIPNFTDRVRARRQEVFGKSRETTLFNRAYLIALSSNDHKAAGEMIKLLLGHFAGLELPTQRTEIEAGQNLMELVNRARKTKIIEGETVEPVSDAGNSA